MSDPTRPPKPAVTGHRVNYDLNVCSERGVRDGHDPGAGRRRYRELLVTVRDSVDARHSGFDVDLDEVLAELRESYGGADHDNVARGLETLEDHATHWGNFVVWG